VKNRLVWIFTYRPRWSRLDRLEWLTVLMLWLIAVLLLTSCAGPCRPTIHPNNPANLKTIQTAGMVESAGMQCHWSY